MCVFPASPGLQGSPGDVNFRAGKVYTCRYFFGYELPRIEGLAIRLLNGDGLTMDIKNDYLEE